jgi:hypothetical protein
MAKIAFLGLAWLPKGAGSGGPVANAATRFHRDRIRVAGPPYVRLPAITYVAGPDGARRASVPAAFRAAGPVSARPSVLDSQICESRYVFSYRRNTSAGREPTGSRPSAGIVIATLAAVLSAPRIANTPLPRETVPTS